MDRLLWILFVFVVAILASVVGSFLAWLFGFRQSAPTPTMPARNAPTGAGAVVFWVFAGCGCFALMMMGGTAVVMILVENLRNPDPVNPNPIEARGGNKPPPKIEDPVAPIPEDLGPKEKQTLILGGAFDPTFKDIAPEGGGLIGFDVGLGQAFGVELVKSIQPRYRVGQAETGAGNSGPISPRSSPCGPGRATPSPPSTSRPAWS
ncbi:MAG: hypothetical protein HYR84_04565 [Planctomycetes bacterium]|nr:hypothetical protein [Planctomycetota bacterium]